MSRPDSWRAGPGPGSRYESSSGFGDGSVAPSRAGPGPGSRYESSSGFGDGSVAPSRAGPGSRYESRSGFGDGYEAPSGSGFRFEALSRPGYGYGYGPGSVAPFESRARSGFGDGPVVPFESRARSGFGDGPVVPFESRAKSGFGDGPGAPSGSRSSNRCKFESGFTFGCGSNDSVPTKYNIFHTTPSKNKFITGILLQQEMEEALSDDLIKKIEDKLTNALKDQENIKQGADYLTNIFREYKRYVEKQTRDSRETAFSTKRELLQVVFASGLLLEKQRTLSTYGQDAHNESVARSSGPSNLENAKTIFEDAINRYRDYLLKTFVDSGHPIITPRGFVCGDIRSYIEDAFRQLYPNGYNILNRIPCIRIQSIPIQGHTCELFLTISQDKIELICNLEGTHDPVYQCAFYRSADGKSLLFIAKITGNPGFRNAHITLVLPIRSRWDPRINTANPHMTFAHKKPEVRIYFNCSVKAFSLHRMLTKFGEYIAKPSKTTIQLFRSMHDEHIEHLKNMLEIEKERKREKREEGKRRRLGTDGGSTNKILKIKEQIKIIKAKYKTTKLDKYLIQIDKLKEKIEQLKLKEKKNKIKEQIKEVKALHKLNPKKAYVNKMIKLKEKLNNM